MESKHSLFYHRIPKTDILWNKVKNYNHGRCGGRNLGNTCYMNSSIACLSNCSELTSYFLSEEYNYENEINEKTKQGTRGKLPRKWYELLKEYWLSNDSYGNPSSFKNTMGNFAPRFSGYGQQDSNEFMIFFLDFMNEDLNKNSEKKYEEIKEQQSNENDIDCAKRFWNYFLHRNNSIITDLFTGLFKNCVSCECGYTSITYQPFNILQLPIPDEKKFKNKDNIEIEINFYNDTESIIYTYKIKINKKMDEITINDLKKEMNKYGVIENENYIFFEVAEKILIKFLSLETKLSDISEISKIYCFKVKSDKSKFVPLYIFIDKEEQSNYPRIIEINKNTELKHIIKQFYEYIKEYLNDNNIDSSYYYDRFINQNKKNLPFQFIFKKDEENKIDLINLYLKNSSIDINDCLTKIEKEKYYFSINIHSSNELTKKPINLNVFEEKELKKQSRNFYYGSRNNNISLEDCFEAFREEETLKRGNEWYCCKCKKHVLAKKKMDLFYLPKLFVICLKRFSKGRYWGKNDDNVDFKINNMNMKDFVCGPDKDNSIYDCFAVSQHYGSTGGGHYTAICKNIDGNWYGYNDSSCHRASESEVVSSAAYVIFYRRKTD